MAMKFQVPIESMPQYVREFASYKAVIQGCSEKTINEYLFDLRTFFRYMLSVRNGISVDDEAFENIDISGIDLDFIKSIGTDDVYEFLMYAGNVRGNSSAAKARKLSALQAFFKYMVVKRKLLEVNPVIDIETPKKKKQLPKYLSLEESLSLLDSIKNDETSKNTVRDYAIITLFLNCGMRLSELVGINLNDIDKELRSMRVLGKGSKERVIYLNDACKQALVEYLKIRLSDEKKHIKDPALFLSSRDKRISNKTVQWVVYKYLDAAGLEYKHYSTHKLRHTAATLMYQNGNVDVRVLKDILGHEQLNTTQIYTHVSDESMENAVNQNPLASVSAKKDENK